MGQKPSLVGGACIIAGVCVGAGMLGLPSAGAGAWTIWSVLAITLTMIVMTLSGWMLLESYQGYPLRVSFDTVTRELLGEKLNALNNLTVNLAGDLGARGIRVNAVAPGPIWTPLIPATMAAAKWRGSGRTRPWAGRGSRSRWPLPMCFSPLTRPVTSAAPCWVSPVASRCSEAPTTAPSIGDSSSSLPFHNESCCTRSSGRPSEAASTGVPSGDQSGPWP